MVYTAIYMNNKGVVTHRSCPSVPDRKSAWSDACKIADTGECLVALVPGTHPVYTYDKLTPSSDNTGIKSHDLFEIH